MEEKSYELSNHLGNVHITLSDYRRKEEDDQGEVTYFSQVKSASDYYPFGQLLTEGNYSAEDYRFGFNGKEMDNEVKGAGNQYDYGFRIYNPRIAKFLSVDPLTASFPWLTPYQFASNSPIKHIDLDGLEAKKHLSDVKEVGLQMITKSKYFKNHAFIELSKSTIGDKALENSFIREQLAFSSKGQEISNYSYVSEGDEIPLELRKKVYGNSVTWCNQFAHNFTLNVLGESPFGKYSVSSMKANRMNQYMNQSKDQFYKVDINKSWEYVNSGALVYYSWKNPSGNSGHIAVGYPTAEDKMKKRSIDGETYNFGQIAQAGRDVDIFHLNEGFGENKFNSLQVFVLKGSYDYADERIELSKSLPEPIESRGTTKIENN